MENKRKPQGGNMIAGKLLYTFQKIVIPHCTITWIVIKMSLNIEVNFCSISSFKHNENTHDWISYLVLSWIYVTTLLGTKCVVYRLITAQHIILSSLKFSESSKNVNDERQNYASF